MLMLMATEAMTDMKTIFTADVIIWTLSSTDQFTSDNTYSTPAHVPLTCMLPEQVQI